MSAARTRSSTATRRVSRGRVVAFTVIVTLIVAATAVYLAARLDRERGPSGSVATRPLTQVESAPRILFRNETRARYGVIAMVALDDPTGPRALTSHQCERLYSAVHETVCVSLNHLSILYESHLLDSRFRPTRELRLGGTPSRARLSPDGTLATTTAFTAVGDSYAASRFSTRTFVTDLDSGMPGVSLEDFTLIHQGKKIAPIDRNYWGVTFAADDNLFYATVRFDSHTWLVRGDLARRTVTTMRPDAECPSLSPDGTRLVYKKRLDMPAGHWRLTALNLDTGVETPLAETRSVDDQVEWLDDDHVLYARPQHGSDTSINDIYVVAANGTGKPKLLIPDASSPSVLH